MACAKGVIAGKPVKDTCSGHVKALTKMECMQFCLTRGSTMCHKHRNRLQNALSKLGCCCPARKWEHNPNPQALVQCPERLTVLFHHLNPKVQLSSRICHTCRDRVDKDDDFITHPAYTPPRKRKTKTSADNIEKDAKDIAEQVIIAKKGLRGDALADRSTQTDDCRMQQVMDIVDAEDAKLILSNKKPKNKSTQTSGRLDFYQSLPFHMDLSDVSFDVNSSVEEIVYPESIILYNGKPGVLCYAEQMKSVCVMLAKSTSELYNLVTAQYKASMVPKGLDEEVPPSNIGIETPSRSKAGGKRKRAKSKSEKEVLLRFVDIVLENASKMEVENKADVEQPMIKDSEDVEMVLVQTSDVADPEIMANNRPILENGSKMKAEYHEKNIILYGDQLPDENVASQKDPPYFIKEGEKISIIEREKVTIRKSCAPGQYDVGTSSNTQLQRNSLGDSLSDIDAMSIKIVRDDLGEEVQNLLPTSKSGEIPSRVTPSESNRDMCRPKLSRSLLKAELLKVDPKEAALIKQAMRKKQILNDNSHISAYAKSGQYPINSEDFASKLDESGQDPLNSVFLAQSAESSKPLAVHIEKMLIDEEAELSDAAVVVQPNYGVQKSGEAHYTSLQLMADEIPTSIIDDLGGEVVEDDRPPPSKQRRVGKRKKNKAPSAAPLVETTITKQLSKITAQLQSGEGAFEVEKEKIIKKRAKQETAPSHFSETGNGDYLQNIDGLGDLVMVKKEPNVVEICLASYLSEDAHYTVVATATPKDPLNPYECDYKTWMQRERKNKKNKVETSIDDIPVAKIKPQAGAKGHRYFMKSAGFSVPSVCIICGFVSRDQEVMIQHLHTHPSSFKCAYCTYASFTVLNIVKHVRQSHLKYSCSYCGKEFDDLTKITKHELFHEMQRCTHCDYYTTQYGLRRHMREEHPGLPPSGVCYVCDSCGFKGGSVRVLSEHMRSQHGVQLKGALTDLDWKSMFITKTTPQTSSDRVCVRNSVIEQKVTHTKPPVVKPGPCVQPPSSYYDGQFGVNIDIDIDDSENTAVQNQRVLIETSNSCGQKDSTDKDSLKDIANLKVPPLSEHSLESDVPVERESCTAMVQELASQLIKDLTDKEDRITERDSIITVPKTGELVRAQIPGKYYHVAGGASGESVVSHTLKQQLVGGEDILLKSKTTGATVKIINAQLVAPLSDIETKHSIPLERSITPRAVSTRTKRQYKYVKPESKDCIEQTTTVMRVGTKPVLSMVKIVKS